MPPVGGGDSDDDSANAFAFGLLGALPLAFGGALSGDEAASSSGPGGQRLATLLRGAAALMTLWDYKLLLLVKAGFEAASAARCPRVVLQLRVDERVEDAGSSFSRPNSGRRLLIVSSV